MSKRKPTRPKPLTPKASMRKNPNASRYGKGGKIK